MANALINPTVIAKRALMQLKNDLVFAKNSYREYKREFVKIGNSVNIRRPVKFYTADGATRVNQDVEEANTSIVVDKRKHVSWKFSTQDLTLTIEEYSERYIEPATLTLAQTIDMAGAALYKNVWNFVGTPGTTPANYAALAAARQRQTEMAVPTTSRSAFMNSAAFSAISGSLTTLNMPSMAMEAWKSGEIGNVAGYKTLETVNIATHTVGPLGGTPLVNGGAQNVTYANSKTTYSQSLVTDGWTAAAAARLKAGDVFTIANVFAVNPVPGEGTTGKNVMPYLQQFVVNADVSSDGSGNATLSISPPIITSGPYQTVSAAPADNAPITVVTGTANTGYPQNLVAHKNAFALVTVPLEMPDGVSWKAQENADGISVRVVKQYDIDTDDDVVRLDVMFGWKAIYPDLAARVTG